MATDPEFRMHGISYVIAAPGGDHHPLLFRLRDPATGKPTQVQAVLNSKFSVFEVIAELHMLANNLRLLVAEIDPTIDYPAAYPAAAEEAAPRSEPPLR